MRALQCAARKADGSPCRAYALSESTYCLWHDPEQTEAATEARRLGGQRRKKERVIAGVYDLDALDSVASLRRVLEIAMTDTLSLETSVARSRTLVAIVGTAAKLLEVGELEERLASLEAALGPRLERRTA